MTNRDRHAELDWERQALQGRPRPIAPAPRRTPRQPPRTGLRSTLAILALSLVAAGLWLVMHAGLGCS